MTSDSRNVEIERGYTRIGIGERDRLPMPKGLGDAADYLAFLRQVPDDSGVQGFTAMMARRAALS